MIGNQSQQYLYDGYEKTFEIKFNVDSKGSVLV